MSRRGRLKRTAHRLAAQQQRVHDLTSALIPHNAKVFIDEIDDAWGEAKPAAIDGKTGELRFEGAPRAKIIRSIRADPLGALKAQGAIDAVQFLAGQIWSWSYMRAELGPLKAIDLTRDAVDGGRLSDPALEQSKRALANLRAAERALGRDGHVLVTDVIGKGLTLAKASDARGLFTKAGREYIGRRFRECLDCLAVVFGCATAYQTNKNGNDRQRVINR